MPEPSILSRMRIAPVGRDTAKAGQKTLKEADERTGYDGELP